MTANAHESEATIPRRGYAPDFLGTPIGLPALDPAIQGDAVRWEGSEAIPYTHFSLALSTSRRFARWVAWNIDGAGIKMLSRSNLDFTKDPRLPADAQAGNELYAGNRLDRGHIARRADLLWGEDAEALQANRDSFYYSNITPQMDDFNQSSQQGIWGRLENALYEDVEVEKLRVSVFGGPVFRDDDRIYRGIALPSEYWKLLVYRENGVLKARTFLLTQDLNQLRAVLALDEFRVYEITLAELEDRTRLRFPEVLHDADPLPALAIPDSRERKPLAGTADIHW
ncbi:DNA/RNA non-specific endonuclease [Paeniglutamicibacter sp. NPDC091659]|uniref:DNA/RNA non-specific endonuclease n=1 Tax=Paeniglutamicibacter sp. NPDC091659 TaxID=3364389 RepID=UPI00381D63ED